MGFDCINSCSLPFYLLFCYTSSTFYNGKCFLGTIKLLPFLFIIMIHYFLPKVEILGALINAHLVQCLLKTVKIWCFTMLQL